MTAHSEGILLIDKPEGKSSFSIVHAVRKRLKVQKVGHTGTLDPFATGLLVILVGRKFTKIAGDFAHDDKEYRATILLGIKTDSFDKTGTVIERSEHIPSLVDVERVLAKFQGTIEQLPPMFSAKKIGGKRLYKLAREGKTVERKAVPVTLKIELIQYAYPEIELHVACSKGTYIRSLADDIGTALGTHGHLTKLRRTRSGRFSIDDAYTLDELQNPEIELQLVQNP